MIVAIDVTLSTGVALRHVGGESVVMTNSTPTTARPPLPAVVSADEAFAALGINRDVGYRAVRAGRFPIPVIHIGRTIRVPRAALIELIEHGNGIRYPDDTATLDLDIEEKRGSARPSAHHNPSDYPRRNASGGRR